MTPRRARTKPAEGADATADAESRGPNAADLALDAIELAKARKQREAEEREAWRRETENLYATLLCRAEQPQPGDVAELAHCIEQLALTPEHVRRDQAALAEYRRLLALNDRRREAQEALQVAVNARKEIERRRKDDLNNALRAEEQARHDVSDSGRALRDMSLIKANHPGLSAAFEVIRAA